MAIQDVKVNRLMIKVYEEGFFPCLLLNRNRNLQLILLHMSKRNKKGLAFHVNRQHKAPPIICSRRQCQSLLLFQK